MKKTGLFYHPSFSRRSYLTVGLRLVNFPMALENLLKEPHICLYESKPVSEELILKVHPRSMIREVKQDPLCSTAWHSAGGAVEAGERIMAGEIQNAFVFIGAGGHHAGIDYFGGFCCFNDVAITIYNLREKFGVRRFAILDTDAHHGDGTRQIFAEDPDVLHVCICSYDWASEDGTKVDVSYGMWPWNRFSDPNKTYIKKVEEEFIPRVRQFEPDLVFWYFGFDTHIGDYGDIGLTGACYFRIAEIVRDLADEVSEGRLEVVLGGGSRTDLATLLIPEIIKRLARLPR